MRPILSTLPSRPRSSPPPAGSSLVPVSATHSELVWFFCSSHSTETRSMWKWKGPRKTQNRSGSAPVPLQATWKRPSFVPKLPKTHEGKNQRFGYLGSRQCISPPCGDTSPQIPTPTESFPTLPTSVESKMVAPTLFGERVGFSRTRPFRSFCVGTSDTKRNLQSASLSHRRRGSAVPWPSLPPRDRSDALHAIPACQQIYTM